VGDGGGSLTPLAGYRPPISYFTKNGKKKAQIYRKKRLLARRLDLRTFRSTVGRAASCAIEASMNN
jgi:hypothetical protein